MVRDIQDEIRVQKNPLPVDEDHIALLKSPYVSAPFETLNSSFLENLLFWIIGNFESKVNFSYFTIFRVSPCWSNLLSFGLPFDSVLIDLG